MRILSLLPSATEIVYLLGLGDQLVGVTHACDFPPEAREKRAVTRSTIEGQALSSREIDERVREHAADGRWLHEFDVETLRELQPDLVLTQDTCGVCAVPHGLVREALPLLPGSPRVVSLNPTRLEGVLDAIKTVGDLTGRSKEAHAAIVALRTRLDAVTLRTARLWQRPRVVCLEWLDPPWVAGHWVPEMVGLAGGVDGLGETGAPSYHAAWEAIVEYAPAVIVMMPCGFDLRRALAEFRRTELPEAWEYLPAVQAGRAWAVDGSAFFNRPGPRLFDGVELLAQVLHPEVFGADLPPDAARRVERRLV